MREITFAVASRSICSVPSPPLLSLTVVVLFLLLSDRPQLSQVRLAHRYAKGEDEELSLPATVDLSQIVRGYTLKEAEEIALTGGGSLAARAQRLKWTTTAGGAGADAAAAAEESNGVDHGDGEESDGKNLADSDDDDDWKVTLGPMEIKTYRLKLELDHR